MPDCDYCGASFDDEDDFADHLGSAHDPDELSRIDRRKATDTSGGILPDVSIGIVALVAIIGLVVGVLAASALMGSNQSGETDLAGDVEQEPSGYGERHYHGGISVEVDGEPIDFSQQQYQMQSQNAHFENGDGETWHVHAQDVTLEYFMASLGIEVGPDTFIHEQTDTEVTPDDDGSVSVRVNGEEVDPSTYVLQSDDRIQIVVTTEG